MGMKAGVTVLIVLACALSWAQVKVRPVPVPEQAPEIRAIQPFKPRKFTVVVSRETVWSALRFDSFTTDSLSVIPDLEVWPTRRGSVDASCISPNGELITASSNTLTLHGTIRRSRKLPFSGVNSMAMDSRGRLYILSDRSTLICYDSFDGGNAVEFGGPESPNGKGVIKYAECIFVDQNDCIYIGAMDRIIRIADPQGTAMKAYEPGPKGEDRVGVPHRITVDSKGAIYWQMGVSIQKIDNMDGGGRIGHNFAPAPGLVYTSNSIQSLAVDGDGRIYVGDNYGRVFRMDDMAAKNICSLSMKDRSLFGVIGLHIRG